MLAEIMEYIRSYRLWFAVLTGDRRIEEAEPLTEQHKTLSLQKIL